MLLHNILLVEDEYIIALAQQAELEKSGFEIHTAHNPEDAIERGLDPNIELILMDIDLGGEKDGIDVAQEILSKREVPIVFLTSHTEESVILRVRRVTRYGYVVKNSGQFVLRQAIEMASELFAAHKAANKPTQVYTHYLQKELYELMHADDEIFEFLQKSSLDGMWYWDLVEKDHEWMNDQFWELLGYDPKEMPHTPASWQNLIFEEDMKIVLDNFYKHLADPEHPYDQVVRYRHKEGHTIWVRCRGMAIRDEDGNPIRMLGAHNDLTERMEAEQRLKNESAILRSAVDGLKIGSWDWDAAREDGYIDWNEHSWDIYGGKDEKIDNMFEYWLSTIHPDDRAPVMESANRSMAGEGDHHAVIRVVRPGVPMKWIQVDGVTIFNEEKEPIRMVGINYDITDQVLARRGLEINARRLDIATKAAGVGIWEWGIVEDDMYWDNKIWELYGRDEEPVTLAFWRETLHPEDRDRILTAVQEAVNGTKDYDVEFRIVRPDGTIRWMKGDGVIVRDNDGNATHMTGTNYDITEIKESQVRQETLLKEVKHRTKNNLLMIQSLIQLKDAQTGVDLSDVLSQVTTMTNLYRIFEQVDGTRADMAGYFDDILRAVFPSTVRISITDEYPQTLEIHQLVSLGLIVNEIATNASKHGFPFTDDPQFHIRIYCEESCDNVHIRMDSTGPAIRESVDFDDPQSLGLRLVKALTLQLDGNLEVDRSTNPSFILTFPAGK